MPKFNRDLHSVFPEWEHVHYCWKDCWYGRIPDPPEWEKARLLNHFLVATRRVTADDVIVADGFWADGLQHLPYVVSHSHGIWGHVTKEDVLLGKEPENPFHHAAQIVFRKRWLELGKRMSAVSRFIADEMRSQWDFRGVYVINNGVDTGVYRPAVERLPRSRPIIVHGVNDPGNTNKGWDHIELLRHHPEWDVLSLDELSAKLSLPKPEALAQADLMVHPSGFEGNSMFVAETLACGVPIVGYNVGFLYEVDGKQSVGDILPRRDRSPGYTFQSVLRIMNAPSRLTECGLAAREIAIQRLSIEDFREEWRHYLECVALKGMA